jgi:hypothetical protein
LLLEKFFGRFIQEFGCSPLFHVKVVLDGVCSGGFFNDRPDRLNELDLAPSQTEMIDDHSHASTGTPQGA